MLAAEQELDARLLGRVVADRDDDRLDQHLLTPRVELADELAEHPLHFAVCGNDDRVGAFVARDDGGTAGRDAAAAQPRSISSRLTFTTTAPRIPSPFDTCEAK